MHGACLAVDFNVHPDKVPIRPAASATTRQRAYSQPKAVQEQKCRQHDRLEDIVSALVQQEATLQGIVELQEDLQGLVLRQTQSLEQRFAEFMHAGALLNMQVPEEAAEDEVENKPSKPSVQGEHTGSGHGEPSKWSQRSHPSSQHHAKAVFAPAKSLDKELAKKSETSDVQNEPSLKGKELTCCGFLGKVVRSACFDVAMCGVITVNFMVTFAELQWKGYEIAYQLGLRANNANWDLAKDGFRNVEWAFNIVYIIELLLRLCVLRCSFFKDSLNKCDFLVVLVSTAGSFVLEPMLDESAGGATRLVSVVRIVRMFRALRVLRFLRVFRFMGTFGALRVLIKTISMSIDSLCWSMMVVFFIILSSAMMMVQLTTSVLEDETQSSNLRNEIFLYYGSTIRAAYTMFEATFSAKWATHLSRRLIEEVNPWFSVFWIIYTVTVNFAVIRVIAALFLKQTMAVAAIDAERTAMEKMKERDKAIATLREIFTAGDTSGDGVISKIEFEQMMDNPEVGDMFSELELEPLELTMLFDLLCEDDGVADQEEFLAGAMKLKNHARTVDMIQVLHEQTVTRRAIDLLTTGIERIDAALHPNNPWKGKKEARVRRQHSGESPR